MDYTLAQQIGWLWIPLVWMAMVSIVLLVAMARGLPQARWILAGFLLAPVALIACFLPRRWLLFLGFAQNGLPVQRPPLRIPPEKLLAGRALMFEVRELRNKGRLDETADLLEVLIDVAEETAAREGKDIPYSYYDTLARVRRASKDTRGERKVLKRFLARTRGSHPKIEKRFRKRLAQL